MKMIQRKWVSWKHKQSADKTRREEERGKEVEAGAVFGVLNTGVDFSGSRKL